ncbi:ABC transporter permease [Microbacterium sp. BK668]|uniref:ABC transporter permease n=1 Tax=Microbacterium sp. BK668 TaxID=2512118 RepID=UPI00105F0E29|nr:ABC transporter permease [Microbacterium sp. BK668]TDN91459.1 peptide/nickel transport system permease protein [Microbacterium sp. BK668]
MMAVADPQSTSTATLAGVGLRRPLRAPQWWGVLWQNKKARFGLILLAVFAVMAVFAPVLAPYDPTSREFDSGLPPSPAHWLGTTGQGQDVLSQAIWGARTSLTVGLLAGLAATAIALIVGMTAGYLGGFTDEVLMFITNIALIVPALPLMLALTSYGQGGTFMVIFVIAVTGWAGSARLKRAQILTLRNRDYIEAARMAGDGTMRIIFREIAPNMTSLIVFGFIGAVSGAVAAEAGLSFLGIGNLDAVSWGQMLNAASSDGALLSGGILRLVVPGLLLAGLITALTFINFGVDALSNPHLRES